MKKLTSNIAILVVLVLMISTLAVGCSSSKDDNSTSAGNKVTEEKKAEESVDNGEEALKPVELTGYLLGEAPAGFDKVEAALNEKLKADINTTVNINYISWGDFSSKYPLILAAGDDVDFIYTANWSFYAQEAAKGAFHEITEESMQEYMPLHYENINRAAFDQAMVDGKMYMVTTPSPDRKVNMFAIREDLRKKYGVKEVETILDLGDYLAAIKENEPEMMPMNLDSSFDIAAPFIALDNALGYGTKDVLYSTGSGSGVIYDIENEAYQLEYMLDEKYRTQLVGAAEIMKEWFDAGYINQDVFANDIRSKDAFLQGSSSIGFGNSQDMQSVLATAESNGWEVKLIPTLSETKHTQADPFINNGVAVAASSQNPERTMMFIDRIINDKDYNYLVYFGIEGENYIEKDGKIDLPEGVTADNNTYPPDAAGFWFTNKNQFLPLATWSDDYVALKQQIEDDGWLLDNPLAAFAPQTDEIATAVANLNQTIVQYFQPIQLGMVPDIDEAFETLDQQLKAAGVEEVEAEIQVQIDAFLGK